MGFALHDMASTRNTDRVIDFQVIGDDLSTSAYVELQVHPATDGTEFRLDSVQANIAIVGDRIQATIKNATVANGVAWSQLEDGQHDYSLGWGDDDQNLKYKIQGTWTINPDAGSPISSQQDITQVIIGGSGDIIDINPPNSELETRIDVLEQLIVDLVPAGYGGGRLTIPETPFNIGVAYITLPFDEINPLAPLAPRGVTVTPATNNFTVDRKGLWRLDVTINITGHDSSANGRSTQFRMWDETDSVSGRAATIGVGRNQEDLFVSMTVIFQLLESDVGNSLRTEIGGGDIITGGTLAISSIFLTHVSELGALA